MRRTLLILALVSGCKPHLRHESALDRLADSSMAAFDVSCITWAKLPAACVGVKADTSAYFYADSTGHVFEIGFELVNDLRNTTDLRTRSTIVQDLTERYGQPHDCGAGHLKWTSPQFTVIYVSGQTTRWTWTDRPLVDCAMRPIPRGK